MNRFEQTTLWQRTLGTQLDSDVYEKERAFLRVEFENFREKAKILAAEIASVLPEFTVHDITHIDALWETAELFTKGTFEFTPPEAFVLGSTFLIHDLGLGLASFPDGLKEIKKEPIWIDTVAALFREKLNRCITEEDILSLDSKIERIATENTLRALHAKHAEKLAFISWENKRGEKTYLIENTDLRESYGSVIGLIAHSHWWSVQELENKLPKILGAPGIFPPSWTIDPVKIACVLRIADAIQIDDRRAPSFLRTIRKPSDYSDAHWEFQQKLYQPRLESNRLVYTSKSPFNLNEVESWWTCYDTLQMIDNELKEVDSLLVATNRQRLNAIGIVSIEDIKRLSKLIAVEGWQPIDAKIRVTNVAKLVSNLGGKQLYGKNYTVPLRELIQNASDAIRARRILENESEIFGSIIVRIGKDKDGQYIEVEDNGIGMSSRVLTGPFLDFGQSFWGTSLMHEELPGLESKGFTSTGRYGIGFFSVFMWGEKVTVTSKRYESGRDTTLVLQFSKGASSRPILRKAKPEEVIKDGGTRIRVWLSSSIIMDKLLEQWNRKRKKITFKELIETLCPSIDSNIILEEKGSSKTIIQANDWITIKPLSLIKRIIGKSWYNELDKLDKQILFDVSNNMSIIKEEDGKIIGRLFLFTNDRRDMTIEGVVTVGGLRASGLNGLIGILIGESDRASRDIGIPIISVEELKKWATSQADLLSKYSLTEDIQLNCAAVVRRCGGNTKDLKIAYHKCGAVNYKELKEIINNNSDSYIVVQDAAINLHQKYNSSEIDFLENVFWVNVGAPSILQTGRMHYDIDWPNINNGLKSWFGKITLEGLTTEAFSEIWDNSIQAILDSSNISSDDKKYKAVVGHVTGKPVIIEHLDIINKPKRNN